MTRGHLKTPDAPSPPYNIELELYLHEGVLFGAADVRPFVVARVRIEDFAIEAGPRDANAITLASHRSEIADDDDDVVNVLGATQERKRAGGGVACIDRLEPRASSKSTS